MTKLEAINICLGSIGEPAVNTLEDAGLDAQIASDLIEEVSRTVQLRGWHWNKETHILSPDVSGNINLPANVAKVDSTGSDIYVDVVQRGLRLFNKADNTYVFSSPIKVKLVVVLPFEELPLSCRSHIAYRAAMTFQQRQLGSDSINVFLQQAAQAAWAEMMRDDISVTDANMLTDSWSVASILTRKGFARGAF